jgi:hypothetical protein
MAKHDKSERSNKSANSREAAGIVSVTANGSCPRGTRRVGPNSKDCVPVHIVPALGAEYERGNKERCRAGFHFNQHGECVAVPDANFSSEAGMRRFRARLLASATVQLFEFK